MSGSSCELQIRGARERTSSSFYLHFHFFPPLSLLCPSSHSPRTVANNSGGVTYVNYSASATGKKNSATHTGSHSLTVSAREQFMHNGVGE